MNSKVRPGERESNAVADNSFAPDRPAPGSFEETLEELYQGEVGGEAFFCALLGRFKEPDQQYKLASLLQLETEFKARIRPIAFAHGIDLVERDESRREVVQFADSLSGASWEQAMSQFAALMKGFVARFEVLSASVPSAYADFAKAIVEHETSIGEFAALEASGETGRSLDRVAKQLVNPLPRPG
jgi:hypothetical protein